MALGVTGEFYKVTFKPTTAVDWATMLVPPGIPTALTPYVINGSDCVIYVIDSASGLFAFLNGQASGYTDNLLNTTTAAFAKETISSEQGVDIMWSKDAGAVYTYNPLTGELMSYSVSEAGDLKSFLP